MQMFMVQQQQQIQHQQQQVSQRQLWWQLEEQQKLRQRQLEEQRLEEQKKQQQLLQQQLLQRQLEEQQRPKFNYRTSKMIQDNLPARDQKFNYQTSPRIQEDFQTSESLQQAHQLLLKINGQTYHPKVKNDQNQMCTDLSTSSGYLKMLQEQRGQKAKSLHPVMQISERVQNINKESKAKEKERNILPSYQNQQFVPKVVRQTQNVRTNTANHADQLRIERQAKEQKERERNRLVLKNIRMAQELSNLFQRSKGSFKDDSHVCWNNLSSGDERFLSFNFFKSFRIWLSNKWTVYLKNRECKRINKETWRNQLQDIGADVNNLFLYDLKNLHHEVEKKISDNQMRIEPYKDNTVFPNISFKIYNQRDLLEFIAIYKRDYINSRWFFKRWYHNLYEKLFG